MVLCQNNHLMGDESDYHCSLLSATSTENIVRHQRQLSMSVMLGQAGGTVTRGGEKKLKKKAFSGVPRLVCLERLQKMHQL